MSEDLDLIKSRPHKYVKRTGSPGNYTYWYKLPDGSIVAGDDEGQKAGRKEHLQRLIAARAANKHSLSNAQMLDKTGYHRDAAGADDNSRRTKASHNLRGFEAGMKKTGKKKLARDGVDKIDAKHAIANGHDYGDHHLEESHHADVDTATYAQTHLDGTGHTAHASPITARTRRPRTPEAPPVEIPAAAAPTPRPTRARRSRPRAETRTPEQIAHDNETTEIANRVSSRAAATSAEPDNSAEIAKLRAKLSGMGVNLDAEPEEEPLVPGMAEDIEAANSEPAITPQEARAKAKAAKARAKALAAAIGPDAPAARVMASADPVFAADEAPIRDAIAAQRAGKNPYLENAKKIFDRISPHIPEKNRVSFQHFLDTFGDSSWEVGTPISEEEIKGAYNNGRTPDMLTWAALKTAMPTYKGLYHDMDEILENAPLNPEVERMKRGFGRKQFERMRPYIKNEWHLANRDAPPPYPTFGDLKSWNEFGTRPEWAAPRAQLAVPKEVHDASPKNAEGKVQLPPKWMPIHLSPLWNYASKIQSDYSASPSSNQVNGSSLNLDMGSDLGSQIMNSLRKYVQARGGASQLVDIPSTKLRNVGLSHNDIFKSIADHDLSDKTMKKIMATKIIDPVAVAPFVEAELQPKQVKKSWSLVANFKLPELKVEAPLLKSEVVSSEELRKSQLIKAIKAKRAKLAQMGIRG